MNPSSDTLAISIKEMDRLASIDIKTHWIGEDLIAEKKPESWIGRWWYGLIYWLKGQHKDVGIFRAVRKINEWIKANRDLLSQEAFVTSFHKFYGNLSKIKHDHRKDEKVRIISLKMNVAKEALEAIRQRKLEDEKKPKTVKEALRGPTDEKMIRDLISKGNIVGRDDVQKAILDQQNSEVITALIDNIQDPDEALVLEELRMQFDSTRKEWTEVITGLKQDIINYFKEIKISISSNRQISENDKKKMKREVALAGQQYTHKIIGICPPSRRIDVYPQHVGQPANLSDKLQTKPAQDGNNYWHRLAHTVSERDGNKLWELLTNLNLVDPLERQAYLKRLQADLDKEKDKDAYLNNLLMEYCIDIDDSDKVQTLFANLVEAVDRQVVQTYCLHQWLVPEAIGKLSERNNKGLTPIHIACETLNATFIETILGHLQKNKIVDWSAHSLQNLMHLILEYAVKEKEDPYKHFIIDNEVKKDDDIEWLTKKRLSIEEKVLLFQIPYDIVKNNLSLLSITNKEGLTPIEYIDKMVEKNEEVAPVWQQERGRFTSAEDIAWEQAVDEKMAGIFLAFSQKQGPALLKQIDSDIAEINSLLDNTKTG